MSEAQTTAMELLTATVDSAHVAQAEALVAAGTHAWYYDPQVPGVIGLMVGTTNRAVAIVYLEIEDVEFSEEFFQTV